MGINNEVMNSDDVNVVLLFSSYDSFDEDIDDLIRQFFF